MHYPTKKLEHKSAIARSFSRAATTYDQVAILQREIGARLLERLDMIKLRPSTIVDLGGGTGFFSHQLRNMYPFAHIINCDIAEGMLTYAKNTYDMTHSGISYICSDGDYLPIKNQSIDFVFSNCALQWFSTPEIVFNEIRRILTPNGLLLFSTFGQDTLKELRDSFSKIDNQTHVNTFLDMHNIGDLLLHQQFRDPVMDMEMITLTYKNIKGLIRDLKLTGAHYVNHPRALRGLGPKNTFDVLSKNYEIYRMEDGALPATFEIVYGHAWGTKLPQDFFECKKNQIPIIQE